MKKRMRHVLGFRSGKPWKMILASLYYLCSLAVLFYGLTTPVPFEAGAHDRMIYILSIWIIFFWMLSPAIFLSETPMRDYLPLFKRRDRMFSLIGMMIVFLFFSYLFGAVSGLHTPEYGQMMEEYSRESYEMFIRMGQQ